MKNAPVKGILKKKDSTIYKEGIKWDEPTIAEHDKERGQYEKITEAKTPYNYHDSDKSEEEEFEKQPDFLIDNVNSNLHPAKLSDQPIEEHLLNHEELQKKLQAHSEKTEDRRCSLSSNENEEESEEKRKKNEEFAKKRKMHYNEFQMIKKMKNKAQKEEDDG